MSKLLRYFSSRGMASKVPAKTQPPADKNISQSHGLPASGGFYRQGTRPDMYLSPVLPPPPPSPKTPEDFKHPEKLGHWQSSGFDWTNPVADNYYMHEAFFIFTFSVIAGVYVWNYCPDYKLRDWAQREAFIRTHRREALGQPLIDKDFIDPERIVLPDEEELKGFNVTL